MSKTFNVTFTGVDCQTNVADLPTGCEYGVLITEETEGRQRYVDREILQNVVGELHSHAHKLSLHVCGNRIRQRLLDGEFNEVVTKVERIQINGQVKPATLEELCRKFPAHKVITQHTPKNLKLAELPLENHQILVDASGGRGKLPTAWVRPETTKLCGFAGGLSPKTIKQQLPAIWKAAGSHSFWIDMEAGVRDTHDWFSVSKVAQVLDSLPKPKSPKSSYGSHFGSHLF